MNQSFKATFLILILSMGLMMLLGIVSAQDSLPVFRIGVLDEERGPIANGARLAVRQINEAGGVIGAEGTRFRLELVIQPTTAGETFENAISAINQARVIAVIGPETTDQLLNNLQFLQNGLNVPILTPALGDTVVASDSTGKIFRIRAAERWLGHALADYIVNDLGITDLITAQLDRNSTAARVGFSVALSQLAQPPRETTLLLESNFGISDIVSRTIANNTPFVAAFGPPNLVSELYLQLRAAGWVGVFSYNEAENTTFSQAIPLDLLRGILGTTTWSVSSTDAASDFFTNSFVRGYNHAPGPIDAASYDAINILASAISRPGDLLTNLNTLDAINGVQGILRPADALRNELTNATTVIQLNALGGSQDVARYQGAERLSLEEVDEIIETTPTATPTPDGVILTIESAVQNVRSGPGVEYDVLGQLTQGETARVIGATVDFSWVIIEFRGQQGWLATYLLEVFGDRSTVPVIAAPPTPTPPPLSATPTAQSLPDIVITQAVPTSITLGTATVINVTVRNNGGVAAGPFAIAATFPPDDLFVSASLNGLQPQSEATVQLPITLNQSTGSYEVVIVADLNDEVAEGPAGEANNDDFIFRYTIDRQLILINSTTLGSGASLDLEGNVTPVNDIQYTGAGLVTSSNCTGTAYCLGLLSPTYTWESATYSIITAPNGINATLISNASMVQGTIIGLLTGEGRRAVLRVESINPGVSITLTYRVYQ